MASPYKPEETEALKRVKTSLPVTPPEARFTNDHLIERGFDAARRLYAEHPELLPDGT